MGTIINARLGSTLNRIHTIDAINNLVIIIIIIDNCKTIIIIIVVDTSLFLNILSIRLELNRLNLNKKKKKCLTNQTVYFFR